MEPVCSGDVGTEGVRDNVAAFFGGMRRDNSTDRGVWWIRDTREGAGAGKGFFLV
jgi:hypothetical protein